MSEIYQPNGYLKGQQDFKNKVLAELEKRCTICKELKEEAKKESDEILYKMWHYSHVEAIETIKTINLIEL
jgi:hypothetical protein